MKGLVIAVLGALALGVGLLVTQGAGAQSGEGEVERRGERFIAETAERLGVTPEALTEAMAGAQVEIIDEAVVEGRLTEKQAARIKERIEEHGPLAGIRPRHGGGPGLCHGARLVVGAAAEVLGEEAAEVAEAVKAGESLAEQAEAAGMSVEDFKRALLAAVQETLRVKVAEGALTQAQADRIFGAIEEQIDRIVNFEGQEGRGPCQRRGDRPAGGERQAEETPS
jgi:hypothetical protein